LSGSTDATVRLWDVATGRQLRQYTGHAAAIWDVTYSPGERVIVSGSQDTTVIVWELSTGEQLRIFDDNDAMIQGVAFSPDGQHLLFSTADGTLRVWQPILSPIDLMAWIGDNRYIRDLSCSEQELYRLTSTCEPEE